MEFAEISLCRGQRGKGEAQKSLSGLQLRFLDRHTPDGKGIQGKE